MSTASNARMRFRAGRAQKRSRLYRSEYSTPVFEEDREIFGKPDDEDTGADKHLNDKADRLKMPPEKIKRISAVGFTIIKETYLAARQEHTLAQLFDKYVKIEDKQATPPTTPVPVPPTATQITANDEKPPVITSAGSPAAAAAATATAVPNEDSTTGPRNTTFIKKILRTSMSPRKVLENDINARNTMGLRVQFNDLVRTIQ